MPWWINPNVLQVKRFYYLFPNSFAYFFLIIVFEISVSSSTQSDILRCSEIKPRKVRCGARVLSICPLGRGAEIVSVHLHPA